MGKRQVIGGFFFFGISIANLIYVCRIFNETKEDPFNTVLLDKKSYFYNVTQLYQKIEKNCKCGENIVNDFCTEEQLLSGCVDITVNDQFDNKKFLRNLLTNNECNQYIKDIMKKEKLSDVFNLNITNIHNLMLGIIVLISSSFFALFLFAIFIGGMICFGERILKYCAIIGIMTIIIASLIGIINFVLFIIILFKLFDGDIWKYFDFLNCPNVDNFKFISQFGVVHDFARDMIIFIILNCIYLVLYVVTFASSKEDQKYNY